MIPRLSIAFLAAMDTYQARCEEATITVINISVGFTNRTMEHLEPEPYLDEREAALAGIKEHREWLERCICGLLKAVYRHGYMRRVVFQP